MAREKHRWSISPARAKELLANVAPDNLNRLSRLKRAGYVSALAREMRAGNWDLHSHQGLLLGKDQRVLDGFHRLSAVVEAGVSVAFDVVVDPELEYARSVVVDKGQRRTDAFSSGHPKQAIAVTNLAVRFLHDSAVFLSARERERLTETILPSFEAIGGAQNQRVASQAPVMLAGILRLANENASAAYITSALAAIGRNDPKSLSPRCYSLWRQLCNEKMGTYEKLGRAWAAFSEKDASTGKIQVKDLSVRLAEIRQVLLARFPEFKAPLD